ncbi:MAG: DUF2796 domain-containing protein, partial [Pseudomonadota bacterium]
AKRPNGFSSFLRASETAFFCALVVGSCSKPTMSAAGASNSITTKAQKKAVSDARKKLEKPLGLFALSPAAGCKVTKASVESGQNVTEEKHGHSHGHSHDHDKKSAKAEEGEVHSEWHAKYELSCSKPASLGEITFAYFDTFANAEELEVSLVGDRGSRKFEATRKNKSMPMPAAS